MKKLIHDYYSGIDSKVIQETLNNSKFRFFNQGKYGNDLLCAAKEWCLILDLEKEIPKYRVNELSNQNRKNRPKPYDHEALLDLPITEEYLVPLSSFKICDSGLSRNGYSFTLCVINESPNSSYWILKVLAEISKKREVYIRLDPLIYSKSDEFENPQYKMWVHGIKNLDWKRINILKEDEFGEWMPDDLASSIDLTQYVWSPRSNEVHFTAEEIPKINLCNVKGGRYFHAIYKPENETVIHLDGALRIYTKPDLERRKSMHVRNSGKIGKRVKIFRIDEEITKELFSEIGLNFFVWNNDVMKYLR